MLGLVRPVGVDLSNILLRHDVVVSLAHVSTLLVVIDALFSVAIDHVLPENTYGLVRDLPLPRPLLG